MTEKNIRMVSYVLLLLSLFIGNFYKIQADIEGFVKVEGVKGYTIVGDGIGFLLLLFPLLLLTLPLYQGRIKQAERFRIGYLIGNIGMMLYLLLFMRHYGGSLDEEWVAISFRLGLSGCVYLVLSLGNLFWEWHHYRKRQQHKHDR
ncbi:hypothetical protein HB943_00365 [Listeria weihenstephanensis]|uniref:Uncharacterized protein n=1 Tax=Listeria weihenstephanensis TaxID=1006155 RepID=A0A841Z117_9LIST|nr:hypothetical protein [Listeria weihenstephanensis]MBC1499034.1 hypothetical protein [Listeria weihenstephanensis]